MIRLYYCPFCEKKQKGKYKKIVMLKSLIRYRPDGQDWVLDDVVRVRCPECNYMEYFAEEEDFDD